MLNNNQKNFIICAINLQEWVIDFGISDKEFKDFHGTAKSTMKKDIDNLSDLLSNL